MPALRNKRHEEFCQLLVDGYSVLKAYQQAFDTKTKAAEGQNGGIPQARPRNIKIKASVLGKKAIIRARVMELQDERAAVASLGFERAIHMTGLNKAAVMLRLWENCNRAMQKEAVTDRFGNVIQYRYDGNAANRALELLGKEMGMFVERTETTLKLEDRIRAMSDDEREAYARQVVDRAKATLAAAERAPLLIDVTPKAKVRKS